MWTTQAIIDWLVSLGITVPLVPGPYVPDEPDQLGVVTTIPGVGLSMQGVADTPGFQLRIRGRQNDPASAETTALDADKRVTFAAFPTTVGTVRLITVQRSGGRPAPLGPEDDGDRTSYVATYLTTVAS